METVYHVITSKDNLHNFYRSLYNIIIHTARELYSSFLMLNYLILYQSKDYKIKEKIKWCADEFNFYAGRSFSSCENFCNKDKCWKRFDKLINQSEF